MGGDGGVIAANRRYMRGAGTADHTGDASKNGGGSGGGAAIDPALLEIERARCMVHCALTNQPLQFGKRAIVTCPYGRLYHKEAVVEALLRRKQQQQAAQQSAQNEGDPIGHIKSLKDLKEIHAYVVDGKVLCPITNKELNGKIACYAIFPGNDHNHHTNATTNNTDGGNNYNVFSERALKEMKDCIVSEYGLSIETKIRLIPPPHVLEEMKLNLEQQRVEEAKNHKKKKDHHKKKHKKEKKKKNKRKREDDDDNEDQGDDDDEDNGTKK